MYKGSSQHAAACVVFAAFAAIACENGGGTARGLIGPTASALASVTAEPMNIAAEFRGSSSCRTGTALDANLNITIRTTRDVFIQRFGFEFVEPLGRRTAPFILPGAVIDPTSSVLPPIPLPTSSPIPFPGQVTLNSMQVPPTAVRSFPFRLQFDCGVSAPGTLFVSVETTDARGAVDVARIRAEVRR